MELTGKFKTEFESWLLDNGYTPKYFEVLDEASKKILINAFIKLSELNEPDIQKAMEKFNQYYQYI